MERSKVRCCHHGTAKGRGTVRRGDAEFYNKYWNLPGPRETPRSGLQAHRGSANVIYPCEIVALTCGVSVRSSFAQAGGSLRLRSWSLLVPRLHRIPLLLVLLVVLAELLSTPLFFANNGSRTRGARMWFHRKSEGFQLIIERLRDMFVSIKLYDRS